MLDPNDPVTPGAVTWTVDGMENFGRLWYWLRFGDNPEVSIDAFNLTIPPGHPLDAGSLINGDIRPDTLLLYYQGNHAGTPFSVEIALGLEGGDLGSGESLFNETITVSNMDTPGGGTLDLRLYQFSNFELFDTPDNDSVALTSGNAGQPINTARQWDDSHSMAEGIVTVDPTAVEANIAAALLAKLNDGSPSVFDNTETAGPGNVGWVFEWHTALDPQQSLVFSQTKRLTLMPAPTALAAAVTFGIVLAARRRRRA